MNANTKKNLILSLRVLIGALFIFSAVAKLYPIEAFEKQLVDLGFASWSTAPFLSRAMIGFEAFLGFAFFQKNYLRSLVIPATAILLLAFCAHLGYIIYTTGGNSGNCGCFGQLLPMTPIEAIVKNIATLGLLGYLYSLTVNYEKKKPKTPIVFFASTYFVLFLLFPVKLYVTDFNETTTALNDSSAIIPTQFVDSDTVASIIPSLDSVNKTTQTKKVVIENKKQPIVDTSKKNQVVVKNTVSYTPKTSIYAAFKNYSDGVTANVDKGTSIVCLLSLECEHCMESARVIGELSKEQKIPAVYFLFFGSPGELDHFFEVAKCKFPYKIIEPQVFFPLLGDNPSPPRITVLKEGNSVADFNFETFSKEKLKKAIE